MLRCMQFLQWMNFARSSQIKSDQAQINSIKLDQARSARSLIDAWSGWSGCSHCQHISAVNENFSSINLKTKSRRFVETAPEPDQRMCNDDFRSSEPWFLSKIRTWSGPVIMHQLVVMTVNKCWYHMKTMSCLVIDLLDDVNDAIYLVLQRKNITKSDIINTVQETSECSFVQG